MNKPDTCVTDVITLREACYYWKKSVRAMDNFFQKTPNAGRQTKSLDGNPSIILLKISHVVARYGAPKIPLDFYDGVGEND